MIQQAIYGRRRVSKCLGSEEANMFDNSRYFGCSKNVLHIVAGKCSGHKECEIGIPDPDLDGTTPCLPGLKMFLEVSYACVEGNIGQQFQQPPVTTVTEVNWSLFRASL